MKRVSLADVATELKVSKTLVSLVLNGKGDKHGISKQTQAKVILKAKELNYFPNHMARGLRIGKSGTIGLIVANIANPFYAMLARHLEDEAHKAGFNLIICSSDEKEEKEIRLLKMLRDRQVDGIIISSTLQDPQPLQELITLGYAVVLIDRDLQSPGAPSVLVDNHLGAYELTRHLIGQGHRNIGHLSISPRHLSTLRNRENGYRMAMKDAALNIHEGWVREVPYDDIGISVDDLLPLMFNHEPGITALFTANNLLAVAALDTVRKLGLHIPEDLAICSFDDIDLFRFCDPPVTACAQPADMIAYEAVRLITTMISQRLSPVIHTSVLLNTVMHVRASSTRYSPKVNHS